jgi:hypothetical protein
MTTYYRHTARDNGDVVVDMLDGEPITYLVEPDGSVLFGDKIARRFTRHHSTPDSERERLRRIASGPIGLVCA